MKLPTLMMICLLAALPIAAQNTTTSPHDLPARDLLEKWKDAVHSRQIAGMKEVELILASDEDGVRANKLYWITSGRDVRAVVHREYDSTEFTITSRDAQYRDWNGFMRTFRGRELGRYRAAIFEECTTLFGPPESIPESSTVRLDGDSLAVLTIATPEGESTEWTISRTTWLPVRSARPGEEDPVVTTYGDWREIHGTLEPFRGTVSEKNQPEYTWTRTSVAFSDQASPDHFVLPSAGSPDTRIDAVVPPIPFNFENAHIIFPLSFNGQDSVLFLLDTGADETVINDQRVDEFHLQPYGKTLTTGGGGTASYGFARGATFRLPGIEISNQHVALIDETGLERALGMKLAGLLGYDFISRFVIEIDYEHLQLTLHDPAKWSYSGKGSIVPVVFDNGIPFCHATISVPTKPSIPAYMVIDFGAAETMTLTSPFVKANDILALAGTNVTVNKLAGLENQFFAQNNVRGHIGRLTIGDLAVNSFPANLSVNTQGAYASSKFAGTIGEGIYRRYRIFLDYPHDRVIFEPTAGTDAPYPERRTYGLTILASGAELHTYTITAVRGGSPAEVDGFKKGDVVRALDGKGASQFTLGELRENLAHEGERHAVIVIRESKEISLPVNVRLISLDQK